MLLTKKDGQWNNCSTIFLESAGSASVLLISARNLKPESWSIEEDTERGINLQPPPQWKAFQAVHLVKEEGMRMEACGFSQNFIRMLHADGFSASQCVQVLSDYFS